VSGWDGYDSTLEILQHFVDVGVQIDGKKLALVIVVATCTFSPFYSTFLNVLVK